MRGPVEQRLAALIDERMGWQGISGSGLHALPTVGSEGDALSDFKLNLCEVLPSTHVDESLCHELATALQDLDEIEQARGRRPYVLLRLTDQFLNDCVSRGVASSRVEPDKEQRVLVSFSNPNLNKPLHLGHFRNNLLGCAVAGLLRHSGYAVVTAQVVSDWGRHICQATAAWEKWGDGRLPEALGIKSDHYVGRYYVRFHRENEALGSAGATSKALDVAPPEEFSRLRSVLDDEVAAQLLALEAGNEVALEHHARITGWVEEGINATYQRIGTEFDVVFRESETRALSWRIVRDAIAKGICRRREDGSIFADLTAYDLGEVTLVRQDGTLVAYAQLLGSYVDRHERIRFDRAVIVNGQQWASGFAVIDTILLLLGYEWAARHERLHYGMVSLPEGEMASRRGLAVHVDDLLDNAVDHFRRAVIERGREDLSVGDVEALALGLVKYALLRVPQANSILFDQAAIWRRALDEWSLVLDALAWADFVEEATPNEGPPCFGVAPRVLSLHVNAMPTVLQRAADHREPAVVARFLRDLAADVARVGRDVHSRHPIRQAVGQTLRGCLGLLNIDLPDGLAGAHRGNPHEMERL